MLKTVVKASSVTNLTDARYFAAWQIDWLGFDLSANGLEILPLSEVKEIKDWIEGPKIIGELTVLDINETQDIINFLSLEYIQVGMYTPIEYINGLQVSTIIKEVIIEPKMTFQELKEQVDIYFDYVDYFLLDFNKNGITLEQLENGGTINSHQLRQICEQYQVFLDINITEKNIQKTLDEFNPLGISLKGGMEEKVGLKSFDELDEIFELLSEEK